MAQRQQVGMRPGQAGTPGTELSIDFAAVLKPTPKKVTFAGLWMLGLAFAFVLPALVPATVEQMDTYDSKMMEAAAVDTSNVDERYWKAKRNMDEANVWFFQWNEHNTQRYELHKRKFEAARADRERLLAKKVAIQREGRKAVGIWSEYALDETRTLFWDSVSRGAGLAKRVTKNQAFWSLLLGGGMHRDETIVSFLLRWLGKLLFNLTFGLVAYTISFIWGFWGIVQTYSPSFFSAISYFLLGTLMALSVTGSIITLMWGTVVGGAYVTLKAAANQARLQNGGRGPRQRLHQSPYGRRPAYGQRPHYQ